MDNAEKRVTRSDGWTREDDERLASIVLYHIRTGSTQLRAFEEAGKELGRSAAACGFRWNGVLRKQLRTEIEAAKKERKSAKKAAVRSQRERATTVSSSTAMQEVILFLQTVNDEYQRLRRQLEKLEAERTQLLKRVQELEPQLSVLHRLENGSVTPEQLAEDSRTLLGILERARKTLKEGGVKLTK